MRKFVVAALCAGLAQFVTGCVDVKPSTITATWNLVEGNDRAPTTCPAGATTIAMYSFADGTAGTPIVEKFPCEAGAGTTGDMPLGRYLTHIQLESDTGALYAQSRSTDVTVFDQADVSISIQMSIDRAEFRAAWSIYDGGVEIDCATAGAAQFALAYTDANGELYDTDRYDCTLGSVVTPGLPLGPWSARPSLLDDTMQAIVIGEPIDAEFTYGNELIDLGDIMLDVQAP